MDSLKTKTVSQVRKPNTRSDGTRFPEQVVSEVWQKARSEFGFTYFRRDVCGTTIAQVEYGKQTRYGWEIDHIVPVSRGGTDDMENLQPLHWENNRAKGDNYPVWSGKDDT